ncbi:MAG: germination protein M [Candidatus Saganbacteria bacterium]|uniref:Germination protein M n=1 Tax=Candidatus Saganbacteria bacterium TaxID=2575572 RepID=A0A833NXG8_UNCSA|nr:MAG: germination protein M [Candidatus Saganbacteria bacterium]
MKAKKNGKNIVLIAVLLLALFIGYNYIFNSKPKIKIYFMKGEGITSVERRILENEDVLKLCAKELISGPTSNEQKDDIFSEIPNKAKILDIKTNEDVVEVIFNEELENYGGGSARVQGLISQIVYTFTEIPGIKRVKISVRGRDEVALGGEGYVIDKPLSREDLR